jgi:hypothetical protein
MQSKSTVFWVGICSLLGSIIGGAFSTFGSDLYTMTKDWILSTSFPITIPQLLFLILGIVGSILIAVSLRKKSSTVKPTEPDFNHVEAWFFYPRRYSWDRGERDPKKFVPRQKLVLVKDLKKAYYIGDYALNLVLTGKIKSWFSEDEQDLDKWCPDKGYNLTHEEGTEEKLLEPYFEAEIENRKTVYHPRDLILFRTHYRGSLTRGFFDNEIVHSEGKRFPSGRFQRMKNRDYSFAHDTLSYWAKWFHAIKGKLNGYISHTSEWCWRIPQDAPQGQYQIFMRVHNCNPDDTAIREKEDSIRIS